MNWRTSAWLRLGWAVLLVFPCLAMATGPDFTAAERQWIKDHPVVRFASDSRIVPLEYLENGRYAGLVSGYLEAISRVSGLKFERLATENWKESEQAALDGRADMLPNAIALRVDEPTRERLLFTAPYFSSPTLVITQASKPVILNLHELDGKKVAIRSGGINQYELRGRFPGVELVDFPSARDALESTLRGDVYATIGSDVVYMPLLRRRYVGRLSVSSVVNDMPLTASMAVRKDQPLLFSIVSKSLEALSARETDVIYERWAEAADYGKPSVASLIIYRKTELALLAIAVTLLVLFAWWAQTERRRAKASELAKSRFLAVMSHEIRTPMNAVLASIEMLQPALRDPHNRKLAQTAATAAESLLGLLDDVLDLSKLDAHQLDLERIPTDIERLARETADIARIKANEKALSIRVSVDNPRELGVMVDPTRVRQILMNLLGNAIKFTREGHIDVVVRLDARTEADGRLHIGVSDTGIGIPLSQQARLFEAYAQADASTTRRYGGTGLGLTICRELVEQMGGSIWLDSKEGEGTTVAFELPVSLVAVPMEGDSAPDDRVPAQSIGEGTVLVVEDHPQNRFVLAEQMRMLGVRAVLVSDGPAALRAIEDPAIRIVLMDCQMPDMDGYEATRRIRQREAQQGLSRMPVIAISAATDDEHRQRMADCGMDGALPKPLRLNDLRDVLQRWLGRTPAATPSLQASDLFELYRQAIEEDEVALDSAIAANEHAQALHFAHRIKGAGMMAGATQVSDCAEAMEVLLKHSAARGELETGLESLREAISRWIESAGEKA